MSADNWEICPQCSATAASGIDPEPFRTFREDYEFYGADEGVITASYHGHCKVCGLKVTFKADKAFWPPTP